MDPLMAAIHHAIAEPIRPKEPYEMAPTDDPVEAAWERFRLAVMRRLEAEEEQRAGREDVRASDETGVA